MTDQSHSITLCESPFSISANLLDEDHFLSVASADWSEHLQAWWVSRVKVHDRFTGGGRGTALMKALQEAVVRSERPSRMIVAPGGYGSDPQDLQRFYASVGFEVMKDQAGLIMMWVDSP